MRCLVSLLLMLDVGLAPYHLSVQSGRSAECRRWADSARTPSLRAARCAEAFIGRQGYTDDSTAVKASTIEREILDARLSREQALRKRYATLERRAYAVCPAGGDLPPGFVVLFRFRAAGRSAELKPVIMSANYSRLWVSHRTLPLSFNSAECWRPPS
jgi:hypothetical protein